MFRDFCDFSQNSQFSHLRANLDISRVGPFDHLKWTYGEAFEQLFGPGRGDFNKNFPKIQMPGELPGGDVEAST